MRKDIQERFEECWSKLAGDIADRGTEATSMVIASTKKGKGQSYSCQVHLTFTKEEDDFISEGHGEVQL